MKFHITDNGAVKRCIAIFRPCKYGCHFSSLEQGNRVNDLIHTGQAETQQEAKTIVLKEQYNAYSRAAKTYKDSHDVFDDKLTLEPGNAYGNELADILSDIKDKKKEIEQLRALNIDAFHRIDDLKDDKSKRADEIVEESYQEMCRNDDEIDGLRQDITELEGTMDNIKGMQKKSAMYFNEVNDKEYAITIHNARFTDSGILINNVQVDNNGRIQNLYIEEGNKLRQIFEITPDKRFLTYDFEEVSTSYRNIVTLEQDGDEYKSMDMLV